MKNKNDDNIGIYLDVDWTRKYASRWLDAEVSMTLYKGRLLLSIPSKTKRAKALAEHASVRVGGVAWMDVSDINAVTTLLREAKNVLKRHQADIRKVAACAACGKIFGGVCDRHRRLFKKYKKPKKPRGLR